MNIDTVSLQIFSAVAETGSFTKAGERVGRTQSAISQQIAKLEALFGKTLFIRDKTLTLTHDGDILLAYARKLLQIQQELFEHFKEPELAGEIKFGMPEDFASVYLSDVLSEFSQIHPRVFLNVECDLTLNLFDRFKKKYFDMVLVKMSKPQDFPFGVNVYTEELEWVAAKKFTMQKKNPIPLILSPQPCVYRASAIEALEKKGMKWRLVFSSPSYAGTIAAVKAGLGVTVLPRTMIPESLSAYPRRQLPHLKNTHITLLKHDKGNTALQSFESFVLAKLKH